MKINHDLTSQKIRDIALLCKKQIESAEAYRQRRDELDMDKIHHRTWIEERIVEARENYLEGLKETREKIATALKEIREHETEQEEILEYDVPEYLNTITTINATKGKMSDDLINKILKNFAGQHQVLLSIKTAFENFEIDLSKTEIEEYTQIAGFAVTKLIKEAENLETSEVSSGTYIRAMLKNLIKYGEYIGLTISEDIKEISRMIGEKENDRIAREAMGLPIYPLQ